MKIKIAIAQTGSVLADLDQNLQRHYRFIEQAIAAKAEVIVFPELSLTGYSLKDAVSEVALTCADSKLDKLADYSRHISIIVGMAELGEAYELFNSALYLENGQRYFRHRKVYLPTYGLFEEQRYFSAGNRIRAFDTRLGRVGLMVCEDFWHPTSGILLAQDGAKILFVISAGIGRGVSGGDKPENSEVWETLNRAAAITTTSYLVYANRSGVEDGLIFWGGSEILNPYGQTECKAGYFSEELIFGEIDFLKLKHARLINRLLSDEKPELIRREMERIENEKREYK